MPRYADHDERREELAQTVINLILEQGLDRVSVRSVAKASGWSVGAIRYYFPRQEDLINHALSRTVDRAFSRITRAEQADAGSPDERVFNTMMAVAPIDDERSSIIRIWIAFMDRGLSQPGIAALLERVWTEARYHSRRNVALLAGIPQPERITDHFDDPFLEETAAVLHVMWDGMTIQGVMSPKTMTPDEMQQVCRRVIGTIARRLNNDERDEPNPRVTTLSMNNMASAT